MPKKYTWKSNAGLKHSKKFLEPSSAKLEPNQRRLSRRQLTTLKPFTDHLGTNLTLYKMRIKDDPTQSLRRRTRSMEHLLCECSAMGGTRIRLLGKDCLSGPSRLRSLLAGGDHQTDRDEPRRMIGKSKRKTGDDTKDPKGQSVRKACPNPANLK